MEGSINHPSTSRPGPSVNIANFQIQVNNGVAIGQLYASGHPLDWLSNHDFSTRPQEVLSSKVEGTCKWFMESESFTSWVGGEKMPLWCPGNAGTGKTFIASMVIDYLQNRPDFGNDVKVVYFYFNQTRPDQYPSQVFGHLLKQLLLTTDMNQYSPAVRQMWNEAHTRNTYPSFETLVSAVKAQAAKYRKVFLILDAIDESPGLKRNKPGREGSSANGSIQQNYSEAWRDMKKGILNLCGSDKINIMITSRSHVNHDISSDLFRKTEHRRLDIISDKEDMENYARKNAMDSTKLRELGIVKDDEESSEDEVWDEVETEPAQDTGEEESSLVPLLDQIVKAVAEKANNVFLLATFHMASFEGCTNVDEIKKAIEELPSSIDGAYDAIMARLNARSDRESVLAKQILPWVCCATRPLTMVELLYALTLEHPSWDYDKDKRTKSSLALSVCEGFVVLGATVSKEDELTRTGDTRPDQSEQKTPKDPKKLNGHREVIFVHATAQDYIEKRLQMFPDALGVLSRSCIGHLSNARFTEAPCDSDARLEERLRRNPFLSYAATSWGCHLRAYEVAQRNDAVSGSELGGTSPVEMALKMLRNNNLLLNLSQINYVPAFKHPGRDYANQYPQQVTALHFAAQFGTEMLLARLLETLVPNTVDINTKDTYQKTALHIAARRGHSRICEILLDHHADIEAQTGDGETPLLGAAALSGDAAVVKLLLDRNANVKMKNKPGGTALHWACLNGNVDVVGELLAKDADVAAEADPAATVRYGVESVGFQSMVWLLLDKLASAGLKNLLGGTPLHWAAFNGHHRVVRLLLQYRADVNAKNLMRGTPLHAASWNGNEKAVQELLEKDAVVSERTVLGHTPLWEACLSGNKTVAHALLKHGADPAGEGTLADGIIDFEDYESVAEKMTTTGVEMEANATEEPKRVLEAVVKLAAPDEIMANFMRDLLESAISNRDDSKGWSALREVTAKGLEALTTLLQSIKKTPAH